MGAGAGECLTTPFWFRRWLGEVVRRGELQTLISRPRIYSTDLERAWFAELFSDGRSPKEVPSSLVVRFGPGSAFTLFA